MKRNEEESEGIERKNKKKEVTRHLKEVSPSHMVGFLVDMPTNMAFSPPNSLFHLPFDHFPVLMLQATSRTSQKSIEHKKTIFLGVAWFSRSIC